MMKLCKNQFGPFCIFCFMNRIMTGSATKNISSTKPRQVSAIFGLGQMFLTFFLELPLYHLSVPLLPLGLWSRSHFPRPITKIPPLGEGRGLHYCNESARCWSSNELADLLSKTRATLTLTDIPCLLAPVIARIRRTRYSNWRQTAVF